MSQRDARKELADLEEFIDRVVADIRRDGKTTVALNRWVGELMRKRNELRAELAERDTDEDLGRNLPGEPGPWPRIWPGMRSVAPPGEIRLAAGMTRSTNLTKRSPMRPSNLMQRLAVRLGLVHSPSLHVLGGCPRCWLIRHGLARR